MNSLFVTVVAQFTAKTITSEKAIYLLSLMSCSMNKLKPRSLNAGAPPVPFPFLYGPGTYQQGLFQVF